MMKNAPICLAILKLGVVLMTALSLGPLGTGVIAQWSGGHHKLVGILGTEATSQWSGGHHPRLWEVTSG